MLVGVSQKDQNDQNMVCTNVVFVVNVVHEQSDGRLWRNFLLLDEQTMEQMWKKFRKRNLFCFSWPIIKKFLKQSGDKTILKKTKTWSHIALNCCRFGWSSPFCQRQRQQCWHVNLRETTCQFKIYQTNLSLNRKQKVQSNPGVGHGCCCAWFVHWFVWLLMAASTPTTRPCQTTADGKKRLSD